MAHSYYSKGAPSLTTYLSGDVKIQFENGIFRTDDDNLANEFDELITKRPNMRRLITKIDREAAVKLAKAHAESLVQSSISGSASTADLGESAAVKQMHARDNALAAVESEVFAQDADGLGLQMSEPAEPAKSASLIGSANK